MDFFFFRSTNRKEEKDRRTGRNLTESVMIFFLFFIFVGKIHDGIDIK